jgi:hypothetical protein
VSAARTLVEVYDATSEETRTLGGYWYPAAWEHAHAFATAHNVTPWTAAGVIAALSPRAQWSVNLRWAEEVLAAYRDGASEPPTVGLPLSRERAWSIVNGATVLEVLGGDKTRAFFSAIIGDDEALALDTWAIRAAGLDRPSLTPRQYEDLAAEYRVAARACGETPRDFQAIVWVATRGRAE